MKKKINEETTTNRTTYILLRQNIMIIFMKY